MYTNRANWISWNLKMPRFSWDWLGICIGMGLIYNLPLVAVSKQEKQVWICPNVAKTWGLIWYSKNFVFYHSKSYCWECNYIRMIASLLEGTCQKVGFEIAFQNSRRKTSLLDCLQTLLSLSVWTKFPQRFFHELFKPFLRQKFFLFSGRSQLTRVQDNINEISSLFGCKPYKWNS